MNLLTIAWNKIKIGVLAIIAFITAKIIHDGLKAFLAKIRQIRKDRAVSIALQDFVDKHPELSAAAKAKCLEGERVFREQTGCRHVIIMMPLDTNDQLDIDQTDVIASNEISQDAIQCIRENDGLIVLGD